MSDQLSDVGFCPTKFKLCPTKIKSDRTNVLSSQIFICSPVKDFKLRAQAIFNLLEKTPPPRFTKFEFDIISTQRSYIHKKLDTKGPHRPNANRQRDANFQFLKTNKTVIGEKFFKICRPNS